jgi:hypothetical protein
VRNQVPKPEPSSHSSGNPDGSVEAVWIRGWPRDAAGDAIHLDACAPFERLAVRTQKSEYELVVLPGTPGAVLVRGGRYFNEFRPAALAGSICGASAIRVRTIEVGGRLELHADGRIIVTSIIQDVSRVEGERDGPVVM